MQGKCSLSPTRVANAEPLDSPKGNLLYLSRPAPLREVVKLVVAEAVEHAEGERGSEAVHLRLDAPQRRLRLPVGFVAAVNDVPQLQHESGLHQVVHGCCHDLLVANR